jgi:hypothetical protein
VIMFLAEAEEGLNGLVKEHRGIASFIQNSDNILDSKLLVLRNGTAHHVFSVSKVRPPWIGPKVFVSPG